MLAIVWIHRPHWMWLNNMQILSEWESCKLKIHFEKVNQTNFWWKAKSWQQCRSWIWGWLRPPLTGGRGVMGGHVCWWTMGRPINWLLLLPPTNWKSHFAFSKHSVHNQPTTLRHLIFWHAPLLVCYLNHSKTLCKLNGWFATFVVLDMYGRNL